jgi:hypothetical protein
MKGVTSFQTILLMRWPKIDEKERGKKSNAWPKTTDS